MGVLALRIFCICFSPHLCTYDMRISEKTMNGQARRLQVGAAKKVVAAKKGPSSGASTGVKKSGGASGVGGGTSSRVRKS